MLDISLPELDRKFLARNRDSDLVATEKFDGTKLTIFRMGQSFDPPEDAWLVTYKGSLITPEEVAGASSQEDLDLVRRESHGAWQYALVWEEIRKNHDSLLASLPETNTELFCEFVQRKSTVLADYERPHAIYALGVRKSETWADYTGARVSYFDLGARPSKEISGPFSSPPVIWKGPAKDFKLDKFTNFTSVLGGRAEGAVITAVTSGEQAKVSRPDQHDKSTRSKKKERDAAGDEFFAAIKKIRCDIFARLDPWHHSYGETILAASHEIFSFARVPKTGMRTADALLVDVKLAAERAVIAGRPNASVGIVFAGARPPHRGHWRLIERASRENDAVLLILSENDRENVTSHRIFRLWSEILAKQLPENVCVRFSHAPSSDAFTMSRGLSDDGHVVRVYAGEEEKLKRWRGQVGISAIVEDRNSDPVTGKMLRAALRQGDEDAFCSLLPPFTVKKRSEIWRLLSDS